MKTHTFFFLKSIGVHAIATLLGLFGIINETQAATSGWQDLGGGKVRLVTNYDPILDRIAGIVEVKLKPGWTTYWRNPGESGIPPKFDFSGSKGMNVSQPLFPVPKVKKYSGVVSIGYDSYVAFPFQARPLTSPLSGSIKLELAIGVCAEICIPAVATMVQGVDGLKQSDFRAANLINTAVLNIPQQNTANEFGLEILTARFDGKSKILVNVTAPENTQKLQLLAEGRANWYIAPGKLLTSNNGKFEFELNTLSIPSSGNITDIPTKFTLSIGKKGIEKTIQLSDKQ